MELILAALMLTASSISAGGIEPVPSALSTYIADHLTEWEIVDKRLAAQAVLQYVASKWPAQQSPFICSADFNGDSLPDIAALLRNKTNGALRLVAFHAGGPQKYNHFIAEELPGLKVQPGRAIDLYVVCEKPGEKRQVEGLPVFVKNFSFSFVYHEKASTLYYFDTGTYKRLHTSD